MDDAMRRVSCWATLLVFLSAASVISSVNVQTQPADDKFDKRGGARRFYGYFDSPETKRISDIRPYFFYEKRGGARAFLPQAQQAWNGFSDLGRLERRGGGRAFYSGHRPLYLDSFYDTPAYYRKRSSQNLWHYLETPDFK